MNPLDFTRPDDPSALLAALLERGDIPYQKEGDRFHFLLSTRGYRWETVCRCRNMEVLVYGRYPFRVQERSGVLEACNEVNTQVIQGGMLLWEGEVLFRTCAQCGEPLDATEHLAQALEYNAAVVAEFWPLIQSACLATAGGRDAPVAVNYDS